MAKRTTKRKKKGGGFRGWIGRFVPDDPTTLAPAIRLTGWLSVIGLTTACIIIATPRLEAKARDLAPSGPVVVAFTDQPGWVHGELLRSLELTVERCVSADPMARQELVEAVHALRTTGWFEAVDQVRRTGPGEIEVDATFVTPFAVIRDDEGDHVVDPSGYLLPIRYALEQMNDEASPTVRKLVVQGARFDRPPRPGMQWEGADVAAGLELLRLIDREPWREQVATVDVSRYLRYEELQLLTNRGSRIHWGAAPGEETPGEVEAKRKLRRLQQAYDSFGHIDAGYDGLVDITNPRGVFAQ